MQFLEVAEEGVVAAAAVEAIEDMKEEDWLIETNAVAVDENGHDIKFKNVAVVLEEVEEEDCKLP